MDIFIGFDPGGSRRFGWCITADSKHLPLPVIATGVADDAQSAIKALRTAMPDNGRPRAAGIDAPLFWSRAGSRHADTLVRNAIREAGAPHASGTVQSVNSLKGACVAQGLLAAVMLREIFPGLPITESHPKALRWLLPEVRTLTAASEHERDAELSAVAAWAMAHGLADWQDLYPLEPSCFTPVAAPLHYFMPGMASTGAGRSVPRSDARRSRPK